MEYKRKNIKNIEVITNCDNLDATPIENNYKILPRQSICFHRARSGHAVCCVEKRDCNSYKHPDH